MPNRPARTRGTMSTRSLPGKRAFGKIAGFLRRECGVRIFFGNLDPAFVCVSSEVAARTVSRVGIFLAC
jgi:hypothetical protein